MLGENEYEVCMEWNGVWRKLNGMKFWVGRLGGGQILKGLICLPKTLDFKGCLKVVCVCLCVFGSFYAFMRGFEKKDICKLVF